MKFNSQIVLDNHLKEDPFAYLFLTHLPPNLPFAGKTRYLKEFALALAKLEAHVENVQARNHWLCITSGFSAAITIAGSTALIPVAGVILSGGAIVAAVGTIVDAVMTKNQVETLAQTLKRHRLALNSQSAAEWAALWEYAESDLFLRSLDYASDGFIVGDKLVQRGKDSPFMRAVDFIAECKGLAYIEVIEAAKAILANKPVKSGKQEKPMLPAAEPTRPQEPTIGSLQPTTNNQQPITNNSPLPPEQWTPDLMGYPSILLYGPQGAGKTSTAAWLIRERISAGHQIKILDPHREYGQWDGLECIGDGMDYDAINDELQAFTEEIKARYKARAKVPNYDPPKLTLVCDEFTQWAKKCSHSATFFEESLTDIRKINLHVLFISHARTLTGLGGSSGLAATRDAGLLELELEAQVDPVTKKASPKLLGWLKYPGMAMNERQRVAIASWMNGSMDFSGSGITTAVKQAPNVVEPTTEPEAIAQPEQPTTSLKVSDSLGEPLKTIWLMAKERADWVTVRDIQRKDFAILKGKGSEQIHQYLGLLADSGYGEIDEEGKSHSSVRFKAH